MENLGPPGGPPFRGIKSYREPTSETFAAPGNIAHGSQIIATNIAILAKALTHEFLAENTFM